MKGQILSQKKKGESKMSKFGRYFLLVTGFALLAVFFARIALDAHFSI
jgi:hypothetical protein